MAQCKYCGRSAGILRAMHEQCRERHDHAVSVMPGFFAKFMESNLSVERFHQLLQSAAEVSFVKKSEMKALAVSGLAQMIDAILKERLPDKFEATRIRDLADTLHSYLFDDTETPELLAKIDVLRELGVGNIPDFVTVAGPMPIELRQGETVIWIFNHVTAYRREKNVEANDPGIELPLDKAAFYAAGSFSTVHISPEVTKGQSSGDMVVTNRNVYAIDRAAQATRLPVAKITALKGYSDGIYISCEPAAERTITISLDDSWFAANLVLRLVQLVRREGRASLPIAQSQTESSSGLA